MTKWEDSHPITPEEQKWRDRVSDLIDQFIAALEMRAEQLPADNEDRDTRLKIVGDIVKAAHGLRHRALDRKLFTDGKYWEPMGPEPIRLLESVRAERGDAARKLISKYNLHPSDEDKIAVMIADRIVDGDLGQFIDDFLKLKKPRNTLSWLSDETDEERKRRESLKAERAERRNKPSLEWKPRPRLSREQIAKLVVGQEVQMMCAVYAARGKVVKITDAEVEVLVPPFTDDEMRQWLSEVSMRQLSEVYAQMEREGVLDMNSLKRRTFRFDKDGHETNESVDARGGGPDPTCGPWDMEG